MTRATSVRAVLALAVLAVSGWLVATRPPKLGLDLRGGTQIVLETRDGELAKANADTTDEALEVLRRRVDELGVTEPTLARSGERRIIVELPGVTDPDEAVEVIGRTAQLTFHPVLGRATRQPYPTPNRRPAQPSPSASRAAQRAAAARPPPSPAPSASASARRPDRTLQTLLTEDGGEALLLGPAAIDGAQIEDARRRHRPARRAGTIDIEFRGHGPDAWQDLTGKAACAPAGDPTRRVAIVLDGKIISSPQVEPGHRLRRRHHRRHAPASPASSAPSEAQDLALLIRAGGLPVPVEVIEQRTVGPTPRRRRRSTRRRRPPCSASIATILFIVAVVPAGRRAGRDRAGRRTG